MKNRKCMHNNSSSFIIWEKISPNYKKCFSPYVWVCIGMFWYVISRKRLTIIKLAKEVVFGAIDVIVVEAPNFSKLVEIKKFEFSTLCVPQQQNGFDCGTYVLKWLKSFYNSSQWMSGQYLKSEFGII